MSCREENEVRKSRTLKPKPFKARSSKSKRGLLTSCLFCIRNHRQCLRQNGQAHCSECTALCQTCHWPNLQQNQVYQIIHEKQQLCQKRHSLSEDLVAGVGALESYLSVAEAQETLSRLLGEMAYVEQRARQLESEELRLWDLKLSPENIEDTMLEGSYLQGSFGDLPQDLDYNFAFPWAD